MKIVVLRAHGKASLFFKLILRYMSAGTQSHLQEGPFTYGFLLEVTIHFPPRSFACLFAIRGFFAVQPSLLYDSISEGVSRHVEGLSRCLSRFV